MNTASVISCVRYFLRLIEEWRGDEASTFLEIWSKENNELLEKIK